MQSEQNTKLTLSYVFSFLVNIVLVLDVNRSEERPHPRNETLVFILEKLDAGVHFLVNGHYQFKFELSRKLLHELMHVLRVLSRVILDCFYEFVIEIISDRVFLLYPLERAHLFFQPRLCRVLVRDDGRYCAGGERNRDNSDQHQNYTEQLLRRVLGCDVAVADCHDGCHCEVEGGHVHVDVIQILETELIDPIVLCGLVKPSKEYPKK